MAINTVERMMAIGEILKQSKQRGMKFNDRESNDRDIRAGKSGEYLWWRNLGILLSACKSWVGSFDSGEVVSLSWVAMRNALRLYNPDAGAGFAGYYRRWIDNACNDLLHKTQIVQVPIHQQENGMVLDFEHPDGFCNDGVEVSSPWDLLSEAHVTTKKDTHAEIMEILEAADAEPDVKEWMLTEGGVSITDAAKKIGMSHEGFRRKIKAVQERARAIRKR